jgi:hypothetical protein
MKWFLVTKKLFLLLLLSLGLTTVSCGDNHVVGVDTISPVTFSVIGDVPYNVNDEFFLREHIQIHNNVSNANFMIHVGDIFEGAIKGQPDPCNESAYLKMANILRKLTIQTFVILGDNEWNDCADPDEAWTFWTTHFARFDEQQLSSRNVLRQSERDENFAWTEKDVLFIGLNLVGGRYHDSKEWMTRLNHNADWVEEHFSSAQKSIYAAIVFGHAKPTNKHETFFTRFRKAAKEFGRPVLYIHGDKHFWIHDHFDSFIDYSSWENKPDWPKNMTRVQVDNGINPPVLVTVSPELSPVFSFNRTPFELIDICTESSLLFCFLNLKSTIVKAISKIF